MATYTGTPGNDTATLTGTGADDTFIPLGGNDLITGGGGFNTLDYKASPGPVTVNLATGTAQDGYGGSDTFTGIQEVLGSAFGDTLTGVVDPIYQTRLVGRGGNDTLTGVAGSRFSVAANYQDSPAAINANLETGVVQDGWGSTDTLVNIFSVQGSAFNDTMLGSAQNDRFRGGAGNDTIDGAGGAGNRVDYTSATRGIVIDLAAGTAQDGEGGVDTLVRIQNVGGSRFNDTILGDAGDNFFLPAQGSDTIDGRGGYNTVSYDYFAGTPLTSGVTGSLVTGIVTKASGTDTLANIQALYGTSFADDLTGRDLGTLRSNLRGLQGNDTLRATAPGTRVTADYRGDPAAVTVNLALGRATDGWGGTDTLVNINSAQGSAFNDTITGGSGNDYLTGNDGDDQIFGGDGDDILAGDAGNDLLDGGAGFDIIGSFGVEFRARGTLTRTSSTDVVQTRGAQVDTWRNIEQVTFLDGRLVYGDTDPAAQVTRLYQAALGRAPDQGGLNFWIGNVQRGAPLADLATSFQSSAEFTARFGANLDNGAYVTRIYQNVLGRDPDAGGLDFWRGQLDSGAGTRGSVLAGISESAENKAGTAGLVQAGIWDPNETAQQVARLYDTALGRLPDVAGLTYWKGAIEAGTQSLLDLAQAFVSSAEFVATYGALGNQAFVEKVYGNTLGRPGDAGGVAYWTGQLDGGLSRAQVTIGFSESTEHQARTAANVGGETPDTYGIRFA